MRDMTKTLLATTLLSAICAAPAFAQEGTTPSDDAAVVVIDQVSLGDVFADMFVVLDDVTPGASAVATATGNTSTAATETGDVDYNATQSQQGDVSATTTLLGGPVYGGTASTYTTSYGNAASSSTTNGTDFHYVTQESYGDVSASSDIYLDGADDVTATTTAAANVSSYETEYGTNRGFQEQRAYGDVTATTVADMCCNNDTVTIASVASGNTVSSYGWTTTSYNGAVQVTDTDSTISSDTDIRMQTGTSVNGSATASGNSITVENEWGYATLGRDGSEVFQGNGAEIEAVSTVSIDDWSGTSGSTAYGVGNSALISNIGSDTAMYANQENYGDVSSYASFDGASYDGSFGYVSSTAIGNAATATMCYSCSNDGVLSGRTNQTNSANVSAYGVARSNGGGFVQGAATAVGNSATYQSFGTNE